MGKSSGGVRGGGSNVRIAAFKETDRAIQVEWRGGTYLRYGDKFGGRNKEMTYKVWLPKSQIIEGNRIPRWLNIEKNIEVERWIGADSRYSVGGELYDAKGRKIGIGSIKEKIARQRERTRLYDKAKANGYRVRKNLKTSTLREMANGTYESRVNSR